jgi:hypothetical protein
LGTLLLIGDSLVKSVGKLFIQAFALYATVAIGAIVTVACATRRIWQAKTPRPVSPQSAH